MTSFGLAVNIGLALIVGFGVNWLADWLPGVGRAETSPVSAAGWLRRGGVLLVSILFGTFLLMTELNSPDALPLFAWILWLCFALFLLILVVDLEHRRVLNVVVYPMSLVGLALVPLRTDLTFASALLGGVVGFGVFYLLFLLRPGGLGAGDVKLAGLIGLLVGFPGVLVSLVSAIALGGVGAAFLLLFHRVGRRGTMAYAPYLSIGAMVALIYGQTVVAWYLGRFGIL